MPVDPARILIIRLSAIGDVIMSTSILPGLRAKYPAAQIDWLTTSIGCEILEGNPLLGRVWNLPLGRWRKQWRSGSKIAVVREAMAFRKQLRQQRYDWVIDAQGLLKSALWARLTGSPRRTSLNTRERSGILMTESFREPQGQGGRIGREYRYLASKLELPESAFRMAVRAQPAGLAAARLRVEATGKRPVLFFPFTTRPQKHWFEEHWIELGQTLANRGDCSVWILGGPTDLEDAERIAAAIGPDAHIVAGPGSNLQEKAAFIALGAASVGVDTGLTHLSFGLGTPTVALFGSTCPYDTVDPTAGRVLFDNLECAPCRRHPTCGGAFTCMRQLTPQRAAAALDSLMAGTATPQ